MKHALYHSISFFSLASLQKTHLFPTGFTLSGVGTTYPNTFRFFKESNSTWITSFYFDKSVICWHSSMERGSMSSFFIILIATVNINTPLMIILF